MAKTDKHTVKAKGAIEDIKAAIFTQAMKAISKTSGMIRIPYVQAYEPQTIERIEIKNFIEETENLLPFPEIFAVHRTTVDRYKKRPKNKNVLVKDKSIVERYITIKEVYDAGMKFFENDRKAFVDWLKKEHKQIGMRPIDMLDTVRGMLRVRDFLLSMEYGL